MAELLFNDGLRYDKKQKYLIIDFETENLSLSSGNKPWQVSFLVAQNKEISEEHNYFIKWSDLNVSKGAAIATGFDQSVIDEKGQSPEKILDIVEKYINNKEYKILFYNGLKFDIHILNIWRKELNRKANFDYIDRCIDVLSLFKATKMQVGYDSNESFLFWQNRILNYYKRGLKSNLTLACKELGIEVEGNFHDALNDVRATYYVFLEMLKVFNLK